MKGTRNSNVEVGSGVEDEQKGCQAWGGGGAVDHIAAANHEEGEVCLNGQREEEHGWALMVCVVASACWYGGSHMEATLLDVEELQSQGLNAAHYPPLVADERHANTPNVTETEEEERGGGGERRGREREGGGGGEEEEGGGEGVGGGGRRKRKDE